MSNEAKTSVQIRVSGPAAEALREWSEASGFSLNHTAETALDFLVRGLREPETLPAFTYWLSKATASMRAGREEEAIALKRREERKALRQGIAHSH